MISKTAYNYYKPKFLFVVPTLNSYELLPKLINTLNEQTYKFWRVIFVDGNSNEIHKAKLEMICESHQNFSVVNQPNNSKGIYDAMNIGLEEARINEWILFWGSDDFAYSNKVLEKLAKVILDFKFKGISPEMIFSKALYVNSNNIKDTRKSFFTNNSFYKTIIGNDFKKLLFLGAVPPHQGTLFNQKILYKVRGYSNKYSLAADLDFFLKLSNFNDILSINNDFYIVKMGKGGVSAKYLKKRIKEVFMIYKKYFRNLWFIPFVFRYIRRILINL